MIHLLRRENTRSSSVECWYCKKGGHVKAKCHLQINDKTEQSWPDNENVFHTVHEKALSA